jgi:hypothetical protein
LVPVGAHIGPYSAARKSASHPLLPPGNAREHQGQTRRVATGDIDRDLAGVPSRSAEPLEQLRRSIRAALRDAEESMSYGLPAFKIQVKIIAGFAAFNKPSELPAAQRLGPAESRQRPGRI